MKETLLNYKGEIFVGTKTASTKLIALALNGENIVSDTKCIKMDKDNVKIIISSFHHTPELEDMFKGVMRPTELRFVSTTESYGIIEGVCVLHEYVSYDHPSEPSGKSHNATLIVTKITYSESSKFKAENQKRPVGELKLAPVELPSPFLDLTLSTDKAQRVTIRKENIDYLLESSTGGTNIYLMGKERHIWVKEDYDLVCGLLKK
jgi:hypothetical protein